MEKTGYKKDFMSPFVFQDKKDIPSLKGLKPYAYITPEPKVEIKQSRKSFGRVIRHDMDIEDNLNYVRFIRTTGI